MLEDPDARHKFNLRMRNQGVKTLRSCGPNTFKDKYGMTDFRARYNREWSAKIEETFQDVDK